VARGLLVAQEKLQDMAEFWGEDSPTEVTDPEVLRVMKINAVSAFMQCVIFCGLKYDDFDKVYAMAGELIQG
jgi:hypothetical protein